MDGRNFEYKVLDTLNKMDKANEPIENQINDDFYKFCKEIQSRHGSFYKKTYKNQIFLSHAYSDRFLAYLMFKFFDSHDIFLYVDWMHSGVINDQTLLKKRLYAELNKSNQLLFLDTFSSNYALTLNTEMLINEGKIIGATLQQRTNNSKKSRTEKVEKQFQVRQYCAWEIGTFYSLSRPNSKKLSANVKYGKYRFSYRGQKQSDV